LAMMTVCARWERTLTRGWTFTPAKAEVVDIRAAIVLGRVVCVTVVYGCRNGDRRETRGIEDLCNKANAANGSQLSETQIRVHRKEPMND
jgi:hypothetical protein